MVTLTMQIAAGSWIVEATPTVSAHPAARVEEAAAATAARSRPQAWNPPPAQGRGLLIDLIV